MNPPCKVFCGAGFFVIFVGVICNFRGIGFLGFDFSLEFCVNIAQIIGRKRNIACTFQLNTIRLT